MPASTDDVLGLDRSPIQQIVRKKFLTDHASSARFRALCVATGDKLPRADWFRSQSLSAYPVGMLFLDLPKGQEHTCMRDSMKLSQCRCPEGLPAYFAFATPRAAGNRGGTYVGSKPVRIVSDKRGCFLKETRPPSQRLTPVQEFRLPKAQVREYPSWLPMSR